GLVGSIASSASGQTVVYAGPGGDHIYSWDRATGVSTLIFDGRGLGSVGGIEVSVSADGSRVAFITDIVVDDAGNPIYAGAGDPRLTTIGLDGTISQTKSTVNGASIVLSPDGSYTAL